MKKTMLIFVLSASLLVALFASCASAGPTKGYATTLEEAHPDRLEKTVIGMSINDFKTIWPEAIKSGVSENGETYEFIYTHLAVGGYAYDYKIYTYFYFSDKKLIKYDSTRKTGL
jgi:hypothetical protein